MWRIYFTLTRRQGGTNLMRIYVSLLCAAVATALALSAYAQSSTTRRIMRAGATSLRPLAAANASPQLSESDPSLTEATLRASEGDKRGIPPDPGSGIPATSATIAKSNPELRLSFDGIRMIDSRLADSGNALAFEPPDQGLCAGNGFVLESVNHALRVYDTN